MKRHAGRLIACLALASSALFGSNQASTSAAGLNAKSEAKIEEYARSLMASFKIPGLELAVIQGGKIGFLRAWGVKDLQTREPMTVDSLFHMASVSKSFTAAAVLQLAGTGRLDLDRPVTAYLPYFRVDDPRGGKITIRRLLTHTAGLPIGGDGQWDDRQYDDGAVERYVKGLASLKLVSAPGEKFQYSNVGYRILADAVAKASGSPFEDYVKRNILDPLGMTASDFLRARTDPGLRASAHVFGLRPQVSDVYPYNRIHAGSANLESNAREMARWAMAGLNRGLLQGRRILPEAAYDLMFAPQARRNERVAAGMGWFLSEHRGLRTVLCDGQDLGARSCVILLPERSLAVAVIANYDLAPAVETAFGTIDILLGFEPERPPVPIKIPVGEAILAGGAPAAIRVYRDLRKAHPDEYAAGEDQLNDLGYTLLKAGRPADAVVLLGLNAEEFPGSSNAFDSLGEAYLAAGNKERAEASYRKSLQLDPGNANAARRLSKLK
jgi:CubicO group peptidase (beta-lactamase class C family)